MTAFQDFIKNAKASVNSQDDDMTFILKYAYSSSSNYTSSVSLMKVLEKVKSELDAIIVNYFNGKLDPYVFNQYLNMSASGMEVYSPSFVSGSPTFDTSPLGVLKSKMDRIKSEAGSTVPFAVLTYPFRFDIGKNDYANKISFNYFPIEFRGISIQTPPSLYLDGAFLLGAITKYVIPHEYTFSINAISTYDKKYLEYYERSYNAKNLAFNIDTFRNSGQFVRGIVNGVMYFGNNTTKEIPWANKASYSFYQMEDIIKQENKINEYALIAKNARETPLNIEQAIAIAHYSLGGNIIEGITELGNPVFMPARAIEEFGVIPNYRKEINNALKAFWGIFNQAIINVGLDHEKEKASMISYLKSSEEWAIDNIPLINLYAKTASGSDYDVALNFLNMQKDGHTSFNEIFAGNFLNNLAVSASNYLISNQAKEDAKLWASDLLSKKVNIVQTVDEILKNAIENEDQLVEQSHVNNVELSDIEKQALELKAESNKTNKAAIAAGLIAAMAIIASAG